MLLEIVKELVIPSRFCLLVAAIGVVLYINGPTRRFSRWLLAGTGLALAVLSSGWTAALLLAPLEYSSSPAGTRPDDPTASTIVVLAAYAAADPAIPLSSWPNGSGMFRIVEATLLRKRCEACIVYVTGTDPTVEVMAEVLVSLGVPTTDLVLDNRATNTAQSALNLRGQIGRAPFYLVTSAGHMPRALEVFRNQGLHPMPAPTDFQLPRDFKHASWQPAPQSLHHSDLAIHEYLGILWYRITVARQADWP